MKPFGGKVHAVFHRSGASTGERDWRGRPALWWASSPVVRRPTRSPLRVAATATGRKENKEALGKATLPPPRWPSPSQAGAPAGAAPLEVFQPPRAEATEKEKGVGKKKSRRRCGGRRRQGSAARQPSELELLQPPLEGEKESRSEKLRLGFPLKRCGLF
jgi:hypothetical protein